MRILVTGAAGFVGRFVCRRLVDQGHAVRAAVRRSEDQARIPGACETVVVPDLQHADGRARLLAGVDAVAHLAAKVHDVTYRSAADIEGYIAANATLTTDLARDAAAAGARVFVFASSIKVNGEATLPGRPFTAADRPQPGDAYAISKLRAEEALAAIATGSGIRVTSIRPPLVYGPGVGGNFLRLMSMVARGLPLPLASVSNRRSLIYVENLADLFARCMESGPPVLVAGDGPAISTAQLVREIAAGLGRPARLLPVPVWALGTIGRLAKRKAEIDRLIGSLEVDESEAAASLSWQPPFARAEGMQKTTGWFLQRAARPG